MEDTPPPLLYESIAELEELFECPQKGVPEVPMLLHQDGKT
jgi:hypothetical protein